MYLAAAQTQPVVATPQTTTAAPASASSTIVGTSGISSGVSLFKPNYVLPAYYTFSPDNAIYNGQTPGGEKIHNVEFAFQFSLKFAVLSNIEGYPVSIDAAYTQKSFWQAYGRSAFFRESDYEPEFFLLYEHNRNFAWGWTWETGSLGLVHQSNGKGGTLERSWNRVFLDVAFSKGHWRFQIEPWYVIHDSTLEQRNPDIAHYLGYGEWVLSYRWRRQEISLLSRNGITSAFSRGYWQMGWTFPLVEELKGYMQVSTGFGQSLIEYNHRTTAVGLGIALNNW